MLNDDDVRLLVTPRPQPLEGPLGYLLRAADANGYPKLQWLARLAGLHHIDPFEPPPDGKLEAVLNLPTGSLDHLFYPTLPDKQGGTRVRFGTGNVRRSAIGVKRSPVCPHCLAEAGYARMAWDLSVIPVCPRHGSRLIDMCPDCGKPFTWSRAKLCTCSCGRDLRTISAPRAGDAAVALGNAVLKKAGLSDRDVEALPFPPEFDAMGLAEAVDLVTFLGAWAVGRGIGTGRRLVAHLGHSARHTMLDSAARVLKEWPEGFYALLDNVRANTGEKATRTGLHNEFGSLVPTLYHPDFLLFENTPRLILPAQFVRTEFETYIEKHWTGGFVRRGNTRLGRGDVMEPQHLPLAEAARQLGMHPSVVRRFIDSGHLAAVTRPMNKRCLILVDRDSLAAFHVTSADLLDLKGALGVAGLSKTPFLNLVKVGLVRAARGPAADGSHVWQFRKSEIERFISRVFSHVSGEEVTDPGVSFEDALRSVTWHGFKVGDLVSEVLAGNLPILRLNPSERGLAQCCFAQPDLDALISRRHPPRAGSVTIPEAAKMLGLNGEATYDLVDRNLLRTAAAATQGRAHLLVPLDAIEAFRGTYIGAAKLAKELGSSPRHVVAALEDLHVTPITGPRIDQGRQYFYLRGQIDAAVQVLLSEVIVTRSGTVPSAKPRRREITEIVATA
jgi:hypothetical protein